MATLEELEVRGELFKLVSAKISPQRREIWILPDVKHWLTRVLPTLTQFYDDQQSTPKEQAWQIIASFLRGEELYEEEDFWLMRPSEADVFELKSPDIRFFGWFARPKCFIIVAADTFENTHNPPLHNGYRDMVIRVRNAIDLDEPKFVEGAGPSDVF